MSTLPWMVVAVFAIVWPRVSVAQDVASKPELRVGDTWMFHTTGTNDGKAVDYGWRRRIDEISPDGKIHVTRRYNVDLFDSSWNPIYAERPDFWPVDFQFPLRVGAAWSYASPTGASTVDGRGYENNGYMKVIAYESITVPAGTFKCFRIEGESNWNAAITARDADLRFIEKWRITNWYCPDVRYLGKSRTERYIGGSFRKGTYHTLDHELVSHRRGRAAPISATSKADPPAASESAERSQLEGPWEGEQGIWRIKGRISGQTIEGTIQCRSDKGWSARSPNFGGVVENDGSVDADTTEELKGWAPRQIKGKLPNLRVVGFGKLDCPNGEVAMKRIE